MFPSAYFAQNYFSPEYFANTSDDWAIFLWPPDRKPAQRDPNWKEKRKKRRRQEAELLCVLQNQ